MVVAVAEVVVAVVVGAVVEVGDADVVAADVGTTEDDVVAEPMVVRVEVRFPEREETTTIVATMAAISASPRPIVSATMGDLRVLM
jgi:hypothetical protein